MASTVVNGLRILRRKGVLGRVSEAKIRLAQGVKVQRFIYRSLRPAEILVASKEC